MDEEPQKTLTFYRRKRRNPFVVQVSLDLPQVAKSFRFLDGRNPFVVQVSLDVRFLSNPHKELWDSRNPFVVQVSLDSDKRFTKVSEVTG